MYFLHLKRHVENNQVKRISGFSLKLISGSKNLDTLDFALFYFHNVILYLVSFRPFKLVSERPMKYLDLKNFVSIFLSCTLISTEAQHNIEIHIQISCFSYPIIPSKYDTKYIKQMLKLKINGVPVSLCKLASVTVYTLSVYHCQSYPPLFPIFYCSEFLAAHPQTKIA